MLVQFSKFNQMPVMSDFIWILSFELDLQILWKKNFAIFFPAKQPMNGDNLQKHFVSNARLVCMIKTNNLNCF